MTNEQPLTPSGRRAAATWVAGTGAFLLLAAAALFVAVNWDRIPPGAKLSVVVGLTLTAIAGGLKLRPTLPATGAVVLHLGALLIPVDVASVGLHRQLGWEELVLAEGAVCSGAFLALSELCRTKLLRWLADIAVVVGAVGVHLTTDVPAGVPLAGAALLAIALRRPDSAVHWAMAAAAVPLFGPTPWPAAAAVGIVAAIVLGAEADRRNDLSLGFTAIAALGIGAVAGWAGSDLPKDADIVGVALAFLAVELGAAALGADPFWGKPVRWLTGIAEGITAVVAVPGALFALLLALADVHAPSPAFAAALVLTGVGWLVADVRRGDPLSVFTLCAAPMLAAAATFTDNDVVTVLGTLGAAALLTGAARRHWDESTSPLHMVAATGLLLVGTVTAGLHLLPNGGDLVLAVVMLWGMANLVDGRAAAFPRIAVVLPLLLAVDLAPSERTIAVGLIAAVLYAVDAVRRDEPHLALASAFAMQLVVGGLAESADLDGPGTGLALAVAALVWAGFAAVVEGRWRLPFYAAAGLGVTGGLLFAAEDPRAFSDVLVVAGALLVALGLTRRNELIGHSGGLLGMVGVFGHLTAIDVTAAEAYAAPVAAYLVAVGWLARRGEEQVSSWWAYAPAVMVLGLTALAERTGGGEAWHALVAGGVGVAAVAIGGWNRQAGPLFTGTALLVAVAVHESLATLASTPTWAWLAAGGTTLLSVGVALERSDRSPVEVGRRLVDVMHERFN